MKKPNFLIVGAAKSGTSAMYQALRQHPDIFMAGQKELRYFGGLAKLKYYGPGDDVGRRTSSMQEYYLHFTDAKNEKIVGEASPRYLQTPASAQDIFNQLGKIKILIVLRNPVDRAFSHYSHKVREGFEDLSFVDALENASSRMEKKWDPFWDYLDASDYTNKIKSYLDIFGHENVHITIFEDFKSSPDKELKKIFHFLGVDVDFKPNIITVNVSGKPKSAVMQKVLTSNMSFKFRKSLRKVMPKKVQEVIRPYFHMLKNSNVKPLALDANVRQELLLDFDEKIKELENLIDKDLSLWR